MDPEELFNLLQSAGTAPEGYDLISQGVQFPEQQLAPLIAARQGLQTSLEQQMGDYQRLLSSTEQSQVGGLSTSQGLSNALVGIIPTLVAAVVGGKDAAGDAASGAMKGLDVHRTLVNEEQKNDLQRLLGLTRNQAQLAGRTQGQIGAIDRQAANITAQSERQRERLEQQKQIAEGNQALRAMGLEVSRQGLDLRREVANQKLNQENSGASDNLTTALNVWRDTGEVPADLLTTMTPRERRELLDRQREERFSKETERRGTTATANDATRINQHFEKIGGDKLRKEADSIFELEKLLQSPNATTDAAIRRLLSRAQGEVGVLTTFDVTSTVPDTLVGDVTGATNYMLNGQASKMTDVQRKAITNYLNAKKGAIGGRLDSLRSEVSEKLPTLAPFVYKEQNADEIVNKLGTSIENILGIKKLSPEERRKELTNSIISAIRGGGNRGRSN